MDRMQRQSILIILSSLEQQIASLRSLMMISGSETSADHRVHRDNTKNPAYTSDEEDRRISEAIGLQAEKDETLEELFSKAREDLANAGTHQ